MSNVIVDIDNNHRVVLSADGADFQIRTFRPAGWKSNLSARLSQYELDNICDAWLNTPDGARAELAQLRADLQAAQERSAEQARQLDEARKIIVIAKNDYQEDVQDGIDSYDKGQRCIDWLAANPAPPQEQ